MKKSLSERMESGKVETSNVEKTIQKGERIMENKKAETKVIKAIGNVFISNDTVSMVKFFANRMKGVLLQDASNSIKLAIGEFYFDNVFSSKDMEYLANCFDESVKNGLELVNKKKDIEDIDIEYLQTFLSEEMIKEFQERQETLSKEYSFEDIKETIVDSFQENVDKVIITLKAIII